MMQLVVNIEESESGMNCVGIFG